METVPPRAEPPAAPAGPVPIVDVRTRWRAGHVALAFAVVMAALSLLRPLAGAGSPRLRLAVTLALGLGAVGSALLSSLRGRGRPETLAFYAFLLLAADAIGQLLAPFGWPGWPLPALLVAGLAVAETRAVALGGACLATLLLAADAVARPQPGAWQSAAAAGLLCLALVLAIGLALAGEKQRLVRTQAELERLRFGVDSVIGPDATPTLRGSLQRVSDRGRRAIQEERDSELAGLLQRLVHVARLSLKAHAVLFFDVDRDRDDARLRAWDGPATVDPEAPVGLSQDPLAFVLDRRVPFYATDFRKLLWALPYYREETRIGTLLAVPVLSGERVSGVLIADRLEVQSFTGDEPEILEGFARLAADAGEQSRAALGREEFGAEFRAIYAVSDQLARVFEPVRAREVLLRAARELVEADGAAFVMVDEEQTRYTVVEAHGWAQEYEGREVGLVERTWAAWVLRGVEEPFLLDDVAGHDLRMPMLVLDEASVSRESLLALPLTVGRELGPGAKTARAMEPQRRAGPIGALLLTGRRGAFGASARRLLGLLANQAAATLYHLQLKAREQRQAARDGLTGLYNRRAFEDQLAQVLAREDRASGRFSLVLLDLDHFKKLNDTYGHLAGDEALRVTARIVSRHLRRGDTAARYGGEELVLILPGSPEEGALRMAERIRAALAEAAIRFEDARLPVTASFGVATWPEAGREGKELIGAADRALYAAKQRGRNRVVAASDLPAPAAEP